MSKLKPCPFCGADNGYVDVIPNPFSNDIYSRGHCIKCHAVGTFFAESWIEGGNKPSREYMENKALEQWNTRPIEDALRKRIAELEAQLEERIDQFITHYNDAVSAGKVSVDVKRELTDAEIEELGAQEAERLELRKTLGWAYDLDEYKDNPEERER